MHKIHNLTRGAIKKHVPKRPHKPSSWNIGNRSLNHNEQIIRTSKFYWCGVKGCTEFHVRNDNVVY